MTYNSRPNGNSNGDSRPLPAVQEPASILATPDLDPKLKGVARAIQLMNGRDDKTGEFKISEELALVGAFYQAATGQLLGRDFFLNDKLGRIEGYQGVERNAENRGVGELEIKYRRLTDEEREDHEVKPNDTAVVCEVYQLQVWKRKAELGLPYSPILGVGIIRESEKYTNTDNWVEKTRANGSKYNYKDGLKPREQWKPITLEGGMTWRKKAQNRALKDALRHTPGGFATGEEVLADAAGRIDGFVLPPEDAHLSVEQAQAWVKKEEWAAPLRNQTPEQAAQRRTESEARGLKATLERKWGDWLFAMEPCPSCGVPEGTKIECHGNGCEFRKLYPNAAPLKADQPEADCVEGQFRPVDDEEIPGGEPAPTSTQPTLRQQAEAIHRRLTGQASGPEGWKNSKADPKEAAYAEGALKVLIRDETQRTKVAAWFGVSLAGDMTVGWARVLRSWINPSKLTDPANPSLVTWVPSDESLAELRTIVEANGFEPAQASLL